MAFTFKSGFAGQQNLIPSSLQSVRSTAGLAARRNRWIRGHRLSTTCTYSTPRSNSERNLTSRPSSAEPPFASSHAEVRSPCIFGVSASETSHAHRHMAAKAATIIPPERLTNPGTRISRHQARPPPFLPTLALAVGSLQIALDRSFGERAFPWNRLIRSRSRDVPAPVVSSAP